MSDTNSLNNIIEVPASGVHTVYDLIMGAAEYFGDRTWLTWRKDDILYKKTFKEFASDVRCMGVWASQESKAVGHPVHAALIGRSGNNYLAAMFGTAAAGGIAIPLDVQLPKAGMLENLKKAETDVIFYDWEFHSQVGFLREAMPEVRAFICLQDMKKRDCVKKLIELVKDTTPKEKEGFLAGSVQFVPAAKPEECAVIIFTSGTTGSAKGVMLSHGNLVDNSFCSDDLGYANGQVILNILPINHVFCLNSDILYSLRYGTTVAISGGLGRLMDDIKFFEPGFMCMVPMIAKALNSRLLTAKKKNPEMDVDEIRSTVLGSRFKRIASGGGYLAPELASSLASFGIIIGQGYGMSECSPKISVPDFGNADKFASVGYIVRNCEVRIVDGEIQVKSPSVMMGYYHDEEKTRETITPDGWLCTGDLGYVDGDGFLYLTGRKKNLIILENGENVSPEGIENLFDGEPLVQDILVFGEDGKIKAEIYPNYEYAQANGIKDIDKVLKELVRSVSETLPNYSQIADVSIRKTPFEKTSSRKIIRSKYFEKKKEEEKREENAEKPGTPLQKQIFDLVASVIGTDSFSIEDNLYDRGLDSLGTVLLVEEIRKQMGKTITFHDLIKNNTIVRLETLLSGMSTAAESYPVEKVYPLTNMMKYFAYVIRGNTTGNLPFTFELDETVDLVRLKHAIEKVLDAHPGVKGNIHFDGRQLMLYRDDSRKVDIPIIHTTDEKWPEVQGTLLKAFRYTEDDDLFHIAIYETETSRYLLFDVAHIMGDGITMNILLEDVNRAYAGDPIEAETYTFYDYIVDDRKREEAGIRQQNIRYYDELLRGSRISRSILNRKEKKDLSHAEQNVIRKRFDKLVKLKIQYFCRQHGISENVLFLTAFDYCTMLFSNEKDIFTNSIHSGRTDGRWRRVAGPLFLTYYSRYQIIPHETTIGLLTRMGKQIMDTMQCFISVPREGEMFFQYQGDIINIREIAGAPARPVHLQLDSLPFHMQVMSDEAGWYTELRYWENRFDPALLDIFLESYEAVLIAMLEERSARRLKKHLPEKLFPMHYETTAGDLNREYLAMKGAEDVAGKRREAMFRLIPDMDDGEKVRVYVLDERYNKKPFGGWGRLYIHNVKPAGCIDEISSPYTPGTLYDTGIEARILPDGEIDFLENSGRIVLTDGSHGRRYYDLGALEKALSSMSNLDAVHAYLTYSTELNEMKLEMDVESKQSAFINRLKSVAGESFGEQMIPAVVNIRCR